LILGATTGVYIIYSILDYKITAESSFIWRLIDDILISERT
jgi:hypothetical protein